MALQKNIVSTRTGAALNHHEVVQVAFGQGTASILVASYPSKVVKDAGKQFSDVTTIVVEYAGENIGAKSVFGWAQEKVLADPTFAGAQEVA